LKNKKKFYDFVPPLLENEYLKTIYNCHECVQNLNKEDIGGYINHVEMGKLLRELILGKERSFGRTSMDLQIDRASFYRSFKKVLIQNGKPTRRC
jgi:hypothetical protein